MKTLSRHKSFIKDMRTVRLTDTQATKLFLYTANLLKNDPLPPEAKNHALQGEWHDFLELHLGGDVLLIYQTDEECVYLTRLGSHTNFLKICNPHNHNKTASGKTKGVFFITIFLIETF